MKLFKKIWSWFVEEDEDLDIVEDKVEDGVKEDLNETENKL